MKTFKVLLLILATITATLSGYYIFKNYHYYLWSGSNRYTDFEVYYKAGLRFTKNPDDAYLAQEVTPEAGGSYNYPPFALVYFAPFSHLRYVYAYTIFSLLSITASFTITFMVLQIMKEYFSPPTREQALSAYILTASFTPVWQDMKHGQVNALVAMSVLIFMWLILRQKYGRAALTLFMGFWLKIYSALFAVIILPFLFHRNAANNRNQEITNPWKIILYLILGVVTPPLLVSQYVPLHLYKYYFIEFIPRLSGVTSLAGFNQSIYGFIARYTHSDGNLASWIFVPIDWWVKVMVIGMTLSLTGWITYRIWYGSVKKLILSVYIMMALLPIISQYGWEYVYVFALPLVLFVWLSIFSTHKVTKYTFFAIAGVVLFWIPKPSDGFIASSFAYLPPVFYHIFFIRWIIAIILICTAAFEFFKEAPYNNHQIVEKMG